jgi:cytochrome c551/c552
MKRAYFCLTILSLTALSAQENSGQLPEGGFLENKTPVLRSALVFQDGKTQNRTRRGALLPLGHGLWGCFDPDLLRWSAIWRAPNGKPPLSYDSMASISFPDGTAKAEKSPELVGKILYQTPELLGVSVGQAAPSDPRKNKLTDGKTPVGPLPRDLGQWLGISLRGRSPVLRYRFGQTLIAETMSATNDGAIERLLEVGPCQTSLTFLLGAKDFKAAGIGARIEVDMLHLAPSTSIRLVLLTTATEPSLTGRTFPQAQAATPIFPESQTVTHQAATLDGPFSLRNIAIPTGGRPIRPTDLAFLSDGTALICTLDGDIWRVVGLDAEKSVWTRVATGLFEPMSIATNAQDQVFVLGRDQITELIDTNKDGHYDIFRNVSSAFLQTLSTRDYATSLEIMADGSFLVAKGGIIEKGKKAELSPHEGTILHISADGATAEVLADGLRLPYVGLRHDGAVFASDQQGNFIPSTPIHLISGKPPFLGYAPTNFRSVASPTEPLFYYPYQTNRSAAAFTTTSAKAFTDLAQTFLQVSWNGSLFGIATPKAGQAFSWQLPLQFDYPILNGATHPGSGRLYVIGLGISGYKPTTPKLLGLASLEQVKPIPSPASLSIFPDHIDITFRRPLAKNETVVPASPALRMFNVKRTANYGSGHFQWDGQAGEQHLQPSSIVLSADRSTVSLAFDVIRRSDILDLSLVVSSGDVTVPLHLFSRPAHLTLASKADLLLIASKDDQAAALLPGDPAKGKPLLTQYACIGCHSLADEKLTGPPLKGVASRLDKASLTESILHPAAKIVEGYPPSMPSFEGVISEQELEHLLAYLLTLEK